MLEPKFSELLFPNLEAALRAESPKIGNASLPKVRNYIKSI
jgi:hypothetical protein